MSLSPHRLGRSNFCFPPDPPESVVGQPRVDRAAADLPLAYGAAGYVVVAPHDAGYSYQDIAAYARGHRPGVSLTLAALHSTDIVVYTPLKVGGKLPWQILLNSRQLFEILPGLACAAEVPDSPLRRAAIASHAAPSGYVLVGSAAGWIHWGGTPPQQLDVAYNRFQTRPGNRYIRSVRKDFYPKDLMKLGEALLTTPERTRTDLAAS